MATPCPTCGQPRREPVRAPNAVMDLQGSPAPLARTILVTVGADGTPIVDCLGVELAAAYVYLYRAAEAVWERTAEGIVSPPPAA